MGRCPISDIMSFRVLRAPPPVAAAPHQGWVGRTVGSHDRIVDGKIVAVSQSKTLVQLLQAPYDSGHFALRMGAGPSALAAAGAADRLRAGGHDVREQVVAPTSSWRAELKTTFELHRAIAAAAGLAYRAGRVPLLLSGNCNATVGMLAALQASHGPRWAGASGSFGWTPTRISTHRRSILGGSSTVRAWP